MKVTKWMIALAFLGGVSPALGKKAPKSTCVRNQQSNVGRNANTTVRQKKPKQVQGKTSNQKSVKG